MLRLAVDIDGTFADTCSFDEEGGGAHVGKVSSMRGPIDAVFERTQGGGGCGDPLSDDPETVKEHGEAGYVTQEGARRDYGVVMREVGAELSV